MQKDPEELAEDFEAYDHGFRRGVFDKCNGRPMYDFSNIPDESIWKDGYMDGWEGNEVRINNAV